MLHLLAKIVHNIVLIAHPQTPALNVKMDIILINRALFAFHYANSISFGIIKLNNA